MFILKQESESIKRGKKFAVQTFTTLVSNKEDHTVYATDVRPKVLKETVCVMDVIQVRIIRLKTADIRSLAKFALHVICHVFIKNEQVIKKELRQTV